MIPTIEVDVGLPTPAYEQIRAQIVGHVAAGTLRPGDRLPTVRSLGADLGIATNTVARAYRELESLGVVASRRRVGTVVTAVEHPPEDLQRAARDFAQAALVAGLDEAATLDLVRGALSAMRTR
ncbi:MAG TPA: GntR family transcriptional regulator [Jiangellaceae bacterium]|nr:GntR family transcriptional regulator [Jiangellaceae bacterium]